MGAALYRALQFFTHACFVTRNSVKLTRSMVQILVSRTGQHDLITRHALIIFATLHHSSHTQVPTSPTPPHKPPASDPTFFALIPSLVSQCLSNLCSTRPLSASSSCLRPATRISSNCTPCSSKPTSAIAILVRWLKKTPLFPKTPNSLLSAVLTRLVCVCRCLMQSVLVVYSTCKLRLSGMPTMRRKECLKRMP